jgi:hypothetical protein
VDFVALIAAIASMFGGGTVTPDTSPVLQVDSSFLMLGSSTYNA